MVGGGDHVGVVLDYEHRVALVAQPQQQGVDPADVARVFWIARRRRASAAPARADARIQRGSQIVRQEWPRGSVE
ncbi:hypothetical protein GCM10023320_24140 [Pseudonocardia adelaidensis]|uniref:Uncharacterized protein n=1 Tax=Pseudonocardia adelaidensis TaxID=648754 RepID=A0ABP9NGI7_9PSEU